MQISKVICIILYKKECCVRNLVDLLFEFYQEIAQQF